MDIPSTHLMQGNVHQTRATGNKCNLGVSEKLNTPHLMAVLVRNINHTPMEFGNTIVFRTNQTNENYSIK